MKKLKITKVRLLILGIIVLFLGIGAYLVIWMLSPRQGSITVPSSSTLTPAQKTYTNKLLDGKFIQFDYSSKYTVKNETAKDNDLEIYKLSADTHYDKQIVVSVSKLPEGKLDNSSDYLFRKLNPNLYTPRSVQAQHKSVEVWVRTDGTEQTAIMAYQDKVATIVFLTSSNNDELSAEVNAFLTTFKWK